MVHLILLGIYILLWLFFNRKKVPVSYLFLGIIFLLYLYLALTEIIGFPNFSQWQMMIETNGSIFSPKLELQLFSHLKDQSNVLNIIFFIPLGFLLPLLWKPFKKFLPTLCYGFLFSFLIEVSQLFTLYRVSDVNDLVMNVTGTIIGFLLWKIIFSHFFLKTAQINKDFIIFPLVVAFISFM